MTTMELAAILAVPLTTTVPFPVPEMEDRRVPPVQLQIAVQS